jgi:hypothetical protein
MVQHRFCERRHRLVRYLQCGSGVIIQPGIFLKRAPDAKKRSNPVFRAGFGIIKSL